MTGLFQLRPLLYSLRLSATSLRMSSQVSGPMAGKIALVTASTEGIGFAIAEKLAQNGASVVISSRKEKNVKEALEKLKGLDVIGTVCHVGKADDRKRLIDFAIEKKGAIDCLVSNAAVNPFFGRTLDTPEEAWDKIFEVNVKAAFLLTREVLPHIEKRGKGSIVYISSIGGYQVLPAIGAYSISKTALLGLTKAIAAECAGNNIRVNCVCPGVIETKFSQALTDNEGIKEEMLKHIPLHRIGKPEEIAGLVSFLCSDESSYLTGESIAVAGGFFSRL